MTVAAPATRRDPSALRHRGLARALRTLRYDVHARVSFWRELAALIEQKFDLAKALDLMRNAYSDADTRPNEPMALLTGHWATQLRNNMPFHDIVAPVASERERMLIQVGVASDRLETVLTKLADYEATLHRLSARGRSSLLSPATLIIWSWGLMVANANLFIWLTNNSHQIPRGLTAKMLHFSESFCHWWSWIVPLVVAVLFVALLNSLARWLDPLRTRVEHRWPYNIYKSQAGCEFLMALNILVAAKQDFSPALRLMSRTAGPYLRWQIDAIEPWTRYLALSAALVRSGRHFPSARIISLFDIYAKDADNFPARLDLVARDFVARYEEQIQQYQDRISNIALFLGFLLQIVVYGMTATIGLPS